MRAWARDHWWTAGRFGLTPTGLVRRVRNRDEPRILCVTVPKSGTHLLERVICLHPRFYRALLPTIHEGNLDRHGGLWKMLGGLGPGQALFTHLPYKPRFEEAVAGCGARLVFLVRDPRDVAVSEVHYALSRPGIPGHQALRQQPDLHSRLRLVIQGGDGLLPLAVRLARFEGWLRADPLLVRFEDLVGPEGGGTAEAQLETLQQIFSHLQTPVDGQELIDLRQRVFSEASPTFRRGRIGGWRDDFSPELRELFDREAAPVLSMFGYQPDAS